MQALRCMAPASPVIAGHGLSAVAAEVAVLRGRACHVHNAKNPFRVGATPAQTLRAIEQALFMIGYDLGTVTAA